MSRTGGELLDVPIDRRSATPLFRQIYAGLTTAILARRLQPGARLPASRTLAGQLGLSRNAIVAAYEQLFAEGYATGRVGSGTYVATDLPDEPEGRAGPRKLVRDARHGVPRLAGNIDVTAQSDDRPFNLGRTLIDARTADQWRRLSARALRAMPRTHLGYGDPRGSGELRRPSRTISRMRAPCAAIPPRSSSPRAHSMRSISSCARFCRWTARSGSRIPAIR